MDDRTARERICVDYWSAPQADFAPPSKLEMDMLIIIAYLIGWGELDVIKLGD